MRTLFQPDIFVFLWLLSSGAPSSFCHEHASIGILKLLITENNLLPYFLDNGLTDADIHFIQELILGKSYLDHLIFPLSVHLLSFFLDVLFPITTNQLFPILSIT